MGILQKLFGGGNKGAAGKMGELLQTLTADLNLDTNQVNNIKSVIQSFREKRREIKSAGGDRSEIQQAKQTMKNQFIQTLSEPQKQIFTANLPKYDAILFND